MVARRRLLNLAATLTYDTQFSVSSPNHAFDACFHKFSSGHQPLSNLAPSSCPNIFYKENCITNCPSGLLQHLTNYGRFSSTANAQDSVTKCWACATEAPDGPFLVCSSCKSVQPLDSSVNYFQIFNLKPGYDVSTNDLERKYKDWQKKLHPDLFQCNSEQEKENSAQQSAQVINAYSVLRRPLSRADYLLQLQGIHVDKEGTVTDSELVMEIMEVRESVEDANNADTLKILQSKIQAKLEECRTSFSTAYERHDFASAVSSVQKMSYYERVNEEIIKKL